MAPVFARKLSRRHKIFPLPATVNLGDISSRTDSQGMLPIFDMDIGQRHLTRTGERPCGEVLHTVQHTRVENLLVHPSEFSAVFIRRLHRHNGHDLLCRERRAPKDAKENGNAEPECAARPTAPSRLEHRAQALFLQRAKNIHNAER